MPAKRKARPRSRVIHAGDVTFSKIVTTSTIPVLVDFWAPWCGPCIDMGPELEKVAKEFGPNLKVLEVNVDRSPIASDFFKIDAVPTLFLFQDRKVEGSLVGYKSARQLERWLAGKKVFPARPR